MPTANMYCHPFRTPTTRLNAMRYVLRLIPYANRDLKAVGVVDPLIVGRASSMFETAESRVPPLLANELDPPVVPRFLAQPPKKSKK